VAPIGRRLNKWALGKRNVVLEQKVTQDETAVWPDFGGVLEYAFCVDHHQATTSWDSKRETAVMAMLDPKAYFDWICGGFPIQLASNGR
jgi:hypothetical protein